MAYGRTIRLDASAPEVADGQVGAAVQALLTVSPAMSQAAVTSAE